MEISSEFRAEEIVSLLVNLFDSYISFSVLLHIYILLTFIKKSVGFFMWDSFTHSAFEVVIDHFSPEKRRR